MEFHHQLARGERVVCFPLRTSRWQGGGGIRDAAETKSEFGSLLSLLRTRERAHDARTNHERNVGANQSHVSLRQGRFSRKIASFQWARIFQAHRHWLASIPRHHRRHHDTRRRLGFYSNRKVARARRLHFANSGCEISYPFAFRRKSRWQCRYDSMDGSVEIL